MKTIYYTYEAKYPYWIHFINEAGQDEKLKLEDYGAFPLRAPGGIHLSREDYKKRLAALTAERKKLATWKSGLQQELPGL